MGWLRGDRDRERGRVRVCRVHSSHSRGSFVCHFNGVIIEGQSDISLILDVSVVASVCGGRGALGCTVERMTALVRAVCVAGR